MTGDNLDKWARKAMRTAFPEQDFPAMQATGEELRRRAGESSVRHIYDVNGYYNGSEKSDGHRGRWTVCGKPMPDQDSMELLPACPECLALWEHPSDRVPR